LHNLKYLLELIELTPPEEIDDIIQFLNTVSIPTRYPENLVKDLFAQFPDAATKDIIEKSEKALLWLKTMK